MSINLTKKYYNWERCRILGQGFHFPSTRKNIRKLELGSNIWFDRLRFLSDLSSNGLSAEITATENEIIQKAFEYKKEYFERKFHWTIWRNRWSFKTFKFQVQVNEKDCMLQVIMYSYYLIIRIEWFKKPLDWWPPAHVAQILGYAGLNLVISLTPLTFFNKKLSCSL